MTEQEQALARKIRELEQIKNHRYGLTWIDVPEAFEPQSINKIPILREVKEKSFTDNSEKPTHILIEGDNYHALQCLNYTHKGKVDVIYIDPPYNLDKDDFTYNDARYLSEYPDGKQISKDDPLRHSSWLSFMFKRLYLSKDLLAQHGVIFISIDEHELFNLKLLCDIIFGASNFISETFVLDNLKGKTNDNFITSVGSRMLIYAKDAAYLKNNNLQFNSIENIFAEKVEEKYKYEDEIGIYNLITFKKTGQAKLRENRPYMYYPILAKDGILFSISKEEYKAIYDKNTNSFNDNYIKELRAKYANYEFILPSDSNNVPLRWTSGFSTFQKKKNIDIIYDNGKIMQKNRPDAAEMLQIYASGTPKSLFYKPAYANGTEDLKAIFGNSLFSFPKPIELIKDIQKLPVYNGIILDFFAGSGTTLQSVLEYNNEIGKNTQCILVQAPEKIWQTVNDEKVARKGCELAFEAGYDSIIDITYERNRRVMQGYTNTKGEQIPGLGGSLKYYKTDFLGTQDANSNRNSIFRPSDDDRVELAKNAGTLVSLAENTLYEIVANDFYQIFTDKNGKYSAVYLQEDYDKYDEFVAEIQKLEGTVVVYTFSWGSTPDNDTAFIGMHNVSVKPYPNAILDTYKNALQKIENNK